MNIVAVAKGEWQDLSKIFCSCFSFESCWHGACCKSLHLADEADFFLGKAGCLYSQPRCLGLQSIHCLKPAFCSLVR